MSSREYKLGVDIGGTKIAYGLFDKDKQLVYSYKCKSDSNTTKEKFLVDVLRDIENILDTNNLIKADLKGIGMGFPSYVDFENGIVVNTSNMTKINDFHARDLFQEHFPNTQIVVDNDTNVAAVAEHKYGAGRGQKHFLYTAVSTGIGSAFIINNQIFRGSYGGAGESGHMIITPDQGIKCGCNNRGCFQSYASGSMIAKHTINAIKSGQDTIMTDMVNGNIDELSAEHLNRAYKEGDRLAKEMIDQIGHYLGLYIYNMFVCLNMNYYIFGGGMVNFGDALFSKVRKTFDEYNHQKDQEIYFKIAKLENFGIIGAAELLD